MTIKSNQLLLRLAEGLNLETADLRLALFGSFSPDASWATMDAITAGNEADDLNAANYSRQALANVAASLNGTTVEVVCDPVTFSNLGATTGNAPISWMLVYLHVTDDTDSVPLLWIDTNYVTNGNNATFRPGGSSGIWLRIQPTAGS